MKKLQLPILVCIMSVLLFSCNNGASKKITSLNSSIDSLSYAIGMDMSKNIERTFEGINKDALFQGYNDFKDSIGNDLLEEKDIRKVINDYRAKKRDADMQARFGKVKNEGLKFLAANKTKPGVKTTASGLQYQVVKEGTGAKPTATSTVKVHYHGTTPEGKVFDSSVDRGEPIEFKLNGVIKGWTEGLQLMKEGGKYKFFIPQELAYGSQQKGSVIKPFMPLVFDVELIKVIDAPATATKAVQPGHEGHNH